MQNDKRYSVILADPPWPAGFKGLRKWRSEITEKYNTMSLEEISTLDIPSIAKENCSLLLWCTHTTLPNAITIMRSWGFKYHCVITWDKCGGFSVAGFHRRTEFCIYGYKGKMNIKKTGKFIPTLITEKKRKHSIKPSVLYDMIDLSFPKDRIELFARRKRSGWDAWGNEVECDINFNNYPNPKADE